MAILKNITEMPTPDWAYITADGRVIHRYRKDGKRHNVAIGKVVDKLTPDGRPMMAPNDNMRRLYSDEFERHYGEGSSNTNHVSAGIFAVHLRVCAGLGLYQCVQRSFGGSDGNALMDLAMMSFTKRSSAAYMIDDFADSNMHYSLGRISSSSVSRLLSGKVSENQIHDFKVNWVNEYKKICPKSKVWLSVDGSNNDSKMVGSALAAHGKSKSGNSSKIIGQIWAVDAETGMPVTWFVNEGNVPDSVSFERIITFLGQHDIEVEGVLLDRGFATEAIMTLIKSLGLEYVIMLKEDCNGFKEMFERHSSAIRRVMVHRIGNGGIYGIVGEAKVFRKSQSLTKVGLFFSSLNADERGEHYSDKVTNEIDRLNDEIKLGNWDISVNPDFERIISIARNDDGSPSGVTVNFEKWQKVFDSKGYFAIAASKEEDAREMYHKYTMRDTSEKVFRTVKSELGFDTLRGHSDASVAARIAVSFIAAVFRQSYTDHCKKINAKPNLMIDKLSRVAVEANNDGIYIVSSSGEVSVSKLFNSVGVTKADLADLALQMTKIRQGVNLSQYRMLSSLESDNIKTESERFAESVRQSFNLKASGECKNSTEEDTCSNAKRAPGRPKGSKNKKTLEREAAMAAAGEVSSAAGVFSESDKPRRGRPKGSKNKRTLEREAAMAAAGKVSSAAGAFSESDKPRRGRPKGSKNKKTLEREAAMAAAVVDSLDISNPSV